MSILGALEASIGSVTGVVGGLGTQLMALASMHPVITTLVAITTAVVALGKAIDHFHVTSQESAKALSDMQSSYDENKSELESLNSELTTTQSRMDELQAKGHLTLTEQEELSNLQAQNAELERTIALKEAQQKIEAKQVASQAQETYKKWTTQEDFFGNAKADQSYSKAQIESFKKMQLAGTDNRVDIIKNNAIAGFFGKQVYDGEKLEDINVKNQSDNINYLIGTYEALQQAQKNVASELDNIADKSKKATGDELEDLNKQGGALQDYYDSLGKKSEETLTYMNEYADVISSTYSAYKEADSLGVITDSQKAELADIESFMTDYMKTVTNTAGDVETAINNIFAKSQFINLKDQLVTAGKSSEEVLSGVIAKTPGLTTALDEAGVSAQQLSDYIMAIADPDSLRIDEIKNQLKDAFLSDDYEINFKVGESADKTWNDFISDKSNKEIETFYKYVKANNLDISNWNLEDLNANWTKAMEESADDAGEIASDAFYSHFKDSEGNATDFSKQIDTFKSNISSLNEARNALLSGGTVDMSELFSNFPDLAQQSGNLVDSLNKLKNQNIADSLSSAYKEMSTSKNPQDIASMKNYLVGLITDSASELSDSDMQQVQSMLVNSIAPVSSGRLAREEATQWVKSLFEDAKDNISPMKDLSNQMDKLKSSAQEIQSRVSLNDSLGIKNTKSDYRALIDNSKEQVRNLQQQNEELQKSLVGLNENSDAYKSITSQIQDNVSSINDARQAQQEWNDTVAQLDYQPLEGLTAYNKAKSTRNAGDNYLDMLSAAKEAQKAREKGLVGTDDFKTVAKMFSPNGMDDYQNWDENYSKIQRYFTEGDTGAKNFLNDLSQITRETENGTIALAEFDDSTKTWSYNIDDVQASADALGISFEAFLAIMGRLQDYGFSNDFFSSIEDGQDHLGSLYSELAQAETELIRLQEERDNGNATVTDTVLRSQEAKIESIKSSILSTQDLIDQLMNRQVSDYEAETQSALRTAQSMVEKMGESDNEVTKKRIQNDLESFAAEYGITLQYDANTGELLGLSQSNQEILQEAMDKDPIEIKYKTPDLTNRPQVSAEKMREYGWDVQDGEYATVYSGAYSNEDETKTVVVTPILPNGDVLDENSLRGYADQLLNGEEIDAEVHLATFEGKDSVQQANNYSDALHSVQEAYYSEDEELQSLISSLGEYNKAQLESIQLADGSYDETYAEAEKSIDNILSTLGLSTDQASALYTVLEQMGLIKPSVEYEADTSNVDEATSEIESSNPTVNVDTEADTENLESEIKNGDYTVEATVTTKTDGSSTETENREATVDYKKGDQDKPEEQTTLVNYDRGVQEPPEPKMTKVNYTLGTQALPQEKTVKVHYDTSEAPKASGTLLTAHADGTAYNVLNLRAHASGTDVSIKRDEVALVNELGNEALIRGGKLYEIPGGTHMQSLKRGDVIINAAQWAEIKKYGSTNTFAGTAYATGTFGQIPIAHAYASNIGTFVSSSSSSSSSTAKTATKTAKSVEKAATKVKQSLDSIIESLSKLFDWIEVRVQRYEENIDLNKAKADNATNYQSKNAYISNAQTYTKKLIDVQEQAVAKYQKQADTVAKQVGLSASLKKKVDNGTINIQSLSEDNKKRVEQYKQWVDKAKSAAQAVEDLKQQQKELAQTKLDNIVEQYDAMLSHIEHSANLINEFVDQAELKGLADSTVYYDALIKNTESSISEMQKERTALLQSLQESVNSGIITVGSVEWYDMQSQINDVTESIQEANTNILEFRDNIRQITWDRFDKVQESIGRLTDEADFLIDLMGTDELFNDNGTITGQGMATFGLRGQNYNVLMEQANKYRDEMKRINAELANDKNNTKLIERKQELLDLQRESILAAEDEKQAIKDLVKNGIEKELDSLQELIDKYTNALDSQKDLNDYQKSVSDQTSEISNLRKQLYAYQNDTSEEGRLNTQNIRNKLKEAEDNLKETEYDKYISDQKDLLDELYSEYEEALNSRLDNIDELIANTIETINKNASDIGEILREESSSVGYTLTSEMDSIWGANGSATGILSTYSENFSNTMTTVQTTIKGIENYLSQLVAISNNQANKDVNTSTTSNSENPSVNGKTPTPSVVTTVNSNSSNSNTQSSDDEILKIIKSGNSNKAAIEKERKAKNHSALWTYIVDKYGHIPTYAIYEKLGKKLGVSAPKNYKVASETNALLKALKKKGYASGTPYVKKDEWAEVNEYGQEAITRPDGSIFIPLKKGSGVINNPNTEKLLSLADNYDNLMDMFNDYMLPYNTDVFDNTFKSELIKPITTENKNYNVQCDVTFDLPNVSNYEEFMEKMQHDSRFDGMITDMTIGRVNGKSNLSKYKYKF